MRDLRWVTAFEEEVRRLANASSTNEATYYPAIRTLLSEILRSHNLPFDVRTGTSERRQGGGADQPDLAFSDRVWHYELGGYPVVKKWLGYRDAGRRAGRPLSLGEIEQLQGIVRRLAVLLTLHGALDQVYEKAAADAFLLDQIGVP